MNSVDAFAVTLIPNKVDLIHSKIDKTRNKETEKELEERKELKNERETRIGRPKYFDVGEVAMLRFHILD